MLDGWYIDAIPNRARADGGAFVNPVTVGVLHKTISRPGSFRPSMTNYFGHQSYPHFTVDVQDGRFKCWQHISIRRAAKALRNKPGGVQTNREGVIQIEIVGWADYNPTLHPEMVTGLQKLMRWIESQTYITPTCDVEFYPYPPKNARLGREPWRMTFDEWVRYSGWCAHQHTPENEHGDVGALDKSQLFAPHPPTPLTPELTIPKEIDMFIVDDPSNKAPESNRQWLCDKDGATHITDISELRGLLRVGVPHLVEKEETRGERRAILVRRGVNVVG